MVWWNITFKASLQQHEQEIKICFAIVEVLLLSSPITKSLGVRYSDKSDVFNLLVDGQI